MARGEEKDTLGTKFESKLRSAISLTGAGTGGAVGLSLLGNSGANTITNPEGVAVTAGAIGSMAGGAVLGSKIAGKIDGGIADRIDGLKPAYFQSGELFLDSTDPFDLGITRQNFRNMDQSRKDEIAAELGKEDVNKTDIYRAESENSLRSDWLNEIVYGPINGFQDSFKTHVGYSGDFKEGYVDENEEVFVQAPRKGDTFEEAMKEVKIWKENKETLERADQYIDQVLSNEGTETVSEGFVEIEIDYDFLKDNEETLRNEVEGGIMTPSDNYDIVVTSHEGEPLPVLAGDFNSEMVERGRDLYDLENWEEVQERKQVLGMYMDALMAEGEFEGHFGDFWYSEGYGREKTKNMFYDPETDTVGVTDIGERNGGEPDEMPDINIEERYAFS